MVRNVIEKNKLTAKFGRHTIKYGRYDLSIQALDKNGNLIYNYDETLERRISIKEKCLSIAKSYPDAYRFRISSAPAMWCAIYDTKGRKVEQLY